MLCRRSEPSTANSYAWTAEIRLKYTPSNPSGIGDPNCDPRHSCRDKEAAGNRHVWIKKTSGNFMSEQLKQLYCLCIPCSSSKIQSKERHVWRRKPYQTSTQLERVCIVCHALGNCLGLRGAVWREGVMGWWLQLCGHGGTDHHRTVTRGGSRLGWEWR
ncbi:hypothetical protein BCR34DRAFT_249654 [Clohesyomyces aquaticus]|uniref:Uncharacterized protein n=1 Tax=Clohesyomyces aquaticus TaxID=1231657 RepID=A0A1Y1ZUR9_9PLEO|nr:hypothetical protein BCR34DRAFT_249654 [Clohesyomyces aquaticus]